MFNQIRFGQKFEAEVANPASIVLYKKRSLQKKETRDVVDANVMDDILPPKNVISLFCHNCASLHQHNHIHFYCMSCC